MAGMNYFLLDASYNPRLADCPDGCAFEGPEHLDCILAVWEQLARYERALVMAGIQVIHEYGMWDGSNYKWIRSILPREEVQRIVTKLYLIDKQIRKVLCYHPTIVKQEEPTRKSLGGVPIRQEFEQRYPERKGRNGNQHR